MAIESHIAARFARRFGVGAMFAALLVASGCGSGSNMGPQPQPISVSIPNKVPTVLAGSAAVTFSATVQNDSANKGVTWSLLEIDGDACPAPCGVLSNATASSVTYTPPSTPSGTVFNTPILMATSVSDATKSDQDSFTLVTITVSILGQVKAVQAGTAAITFHAVVQNDPTNSGVTWSLSNRSGSCTSANPDCGSLSNMTTTSVVYTPPASAPAFPADETTISATSKKVITGDTDTFDIISVPVVSCANAPTGHESLLNGQYAFFAQVFDVGGVVMAGGFAPDGHGNIKDLGGGVGGALDLNADLIPQSTTVTPSGSSYRVGADSTGAGDIGCLQLATAAGFTTTFQFSLAAPSNGVATKGRIIEYDDQSGQGTGIRLTGVLLKQDTTAFLSGDTSHLHANYAFGLDGVDSNQIHFGLAGRFTLNPATGKITSTLFDSDDAGVLQQGVSGDTGAIASVSAQTGRATFVLTGPNSFSPSAEPTEAALYIVNADEFFLADLDPMTIGGGGLTEAPGAKYSGRAIATGTSFSPNAISGNFILHQTGGPAPPTISTGTTTLGLITLTATTASGGTTSGTLHKYTAQTGSSATSLSLGTFALDLNTGRLTISVSGGTPPVLYFTAPAADTEDIVAFAIGTDSIGSFGLVEPGAGQTLTTSSLAGNYFFADEDPGDDTVTDRVGVIAISTSGAITGTENDSAPAGLQTKSPSGTVIINNSSGFGTGDVGIGTFAVTNGTKLFFVDENSSTPASIRVLELQ